MDECWRKVHGTGCMTKLSPRRYKGRERAGGGGHRGDVGTEQSRHAISGAGFARLLHYSNGPGSHPYTLSSGKNGRYLIFKIF